MRHGLRETHGPRYGTNIVGGVKMKADPKTGKVSLDESDPKTGRVTAVISKLHEEPETTAKVSK
jgi:hypothetical protein